jgi:hypothetical protein
MEKSRSGCLTAWLVIMFIGVIPALLIMFITPQETMQKCCNIPGWYKYFMLVTSTVYMLSIAGIWMWKRWGFYGVIAIFFINYSTAFLIGINLTRGAIRDLIGPIILYILLRPVWKHLE